MNLPFLPLRNITSLNERKYPLPLLTRCLTRLLQFVFIFRENINVLRIWWILIDNEF